VTPISNCGGAGIVRRWSPRAVFARAICCSAWFLHQPGGATWRAVSPRRVAGAILPSRSSRVAAHRAIGAVGSCARPYSEGHRCNTAETPLRSGK
jgi:hypothetical protein